MKWALNSATIMNSSWEEELPLWREFGWHAVEVWQSKIEAQLAKGVSKEELKRQMSDAGVAPIGMCAGAIWTLGEAFNQANESAAIAKSLDLAAEFGVPSLTVITIGKVGDDLPAEYDYLVERLHFAANQAAERGVLLNLEFLGGLPINGTLGSGIELVNRVAHPSLGLLFDLCHYYVSASHLEELRTLDCGKLFMVHIDDSQRLPMERLGNDQRAFPGEGRIDVPGLIKGIERETGYDGYLSVELYDKGIWAMEPREVLTRLAKSLREIESAIG